MARKKNVETLILECESLEKKAVNKIYKNTKRKQYFVRKDINWLTSIEK